MNGGCDVGNVHYPPRICEHTPTTPVAGAPPSQTAITGFDVQGWMVLLVVLLVIGVTTVLRSARRSKQGG